MKKSILCLLVFCFLISIVGCGNDTKTSDVVEKTGVELTQDFYINVEKIEIRVGDSSTSFENPEDVKNICELFEYIVGNKVTPNETKLEGFYEIIFSNSEKEIRVILTGPTIFIDSVEYYTNKDIIEPLSEYLG